MNLSKEHAVQPPKIHARALRPEGVRLARVLAQTEQEVGAQRGDLGMVRRGRALAQLVKEAEQPGLPLRPNPSR